MAREDYEISMKLEDREKITNVAFGTTAERAYEMYLSKRKQIYDLEYECDLLVDKYHDEMRRACIPMHFSEGLLEESFDKNKKKSGFAREHFLSHCFSKEFLKGHKVEFVKYEVHGYGRTAIGIVLGIGDYQYTVEIPLPNNIVKPEDKERLMGQVKFRVDRIHKSNLNEFVKTMEPVQMPTYDWKECFEAIETIVAKEN